MYNLYAIFTIELLEFCYGSENTIWAIRRPTTRGTAHENLLEIGPGRSVARRCNYNDSSRTAVPEGDRLRKRLRRFAHS